MKRISIDDLTGFADICECERLLGELVAGCTYEKTEGGVTPDSNFKGGGVSDETWDDATDFPKGESYASGTFGGGISK